jgi:hypothetical protein
MKNPFVLTFLVIVSLSHSLCGASQDLDMTVQERRQTAIPDFSFTNCDCDANGSYYFRIDVDGHKDVRVLRIDRSDNPTIFEPPEKGKTEIGYASFFVSSESGQLWLLVQSREGLAVHQFAATGELISSRKLEGFPVGFQPRLLAASKSRILVFGHISQKGGRSSQPKISIALFSLAG